MTIINIEPICARYGMKIMENAGDRGETIVTKALGVLVENGIYAMSLFLLTCQDKDYGRRVLTRELAGLWKEPGIDLIPAATQANQDNVLKAVRNMTNDISKLILAKKITEQALTFARYHAKTKPDSMQENKNGTDNE